jgi:small subunit ribosomal protein S10e
MPNIVVLMLIKSMLSKKYVSEVFSWQYSYFTLNNDGIKFLREYLGVGENVVPETMKKRFHKKEDDEEEEDRPRRGGARGRRGGRGGRFHKVCALYRMSTKKQQRMTRL